jgi:hypothetical protein
VLVVYLNRVFPNTLSLIEQMGGVEAARAARKVVDHLIELHHQQNTKDTE